MHATTYYGDGSNLTGIAAGSVSGSDRVYSSTGLETSGYLKVTGSTVMAGGTYLNGGVSHKRTTATGDYSISTTDYYIGADTTGGALKLTLPQASNTTNGQTFIIKDEGGASNSNPITVSGSASDTIDGKNKVVLHSPYSSIQIYCNGSNKFFIC